MTTKKLFYKDEYRCQVTEKQEEAIEEARKRNQTQIRINGETLFLRKIEVFNDSPDYGKEPKIYEISTSELKSITGTFAQEYEKHNTGTREYNNNLFFGERTGIIRWLLDEKVIRENDFYKNSFSNYRHFTIISLSRWKEFEKKLEAMRELESRRHYAEVKEREGQLGEDPNAWQNEIAGKMASVGEKLKM